MKISKFQNSQQTNLSKELHNPDSPFLIEIRRITVKPCRAPLQKKKKLFVFIFIFVSFFEKINILKITLILFI